MSIDSGTNLSWKKSIDEKGSFVRKDSVFRDWVKADGSTKYPAAAGRYHLYVSYACPWANRTLIARSLKGLQDVISVDVVDWYLTDKGWHFSAETPGATVDSIHGYTHLRQVYAQGGEYEGRVTVPVLFDKQTKTVVNNESSEVLRMLNSEFNEFCQTPEQKALDLYPEAMRAEIDSVNEWIYPMINNGVYKSGFARSQEAYDVAVKELFEGLDKVNEILTRQRYIAGSKFTEADIRLFVTLIRFDPVYVLHFKCNRNRIIDYPNIWAYVREIYQMAGVKDTVNMEHIIKHYHVSHKSVNPFGIVPINPVLNYDEPHGREKMK